LEYFIHQKYFYGDYDDIFSRQPCLLEGYMELVKFLEISLHSNDPGEIGKQVENSLAKNNPDKAIEICKQALIFMKNFQVKYLFSIIIINLLKILL
jgi:hypothetical protein